MIDPAKLRELAEQATQGEWEVRKFAKTHETENIWLGDIRPIARGLYSAGSEDAEVMPNVRFIAAANPATIIELLDEIELLKCCGNCYNYSEKFRECKILKDEFSIHYKCKAWKVQG